MNDTSAGDGPEKRAEDYASVIGWLHRIERRLDKTNYSLLFMAVYFSSVIPVPEGSSLARFINHIG